MTSRVRPTRSLVPLMARNLGIGVGDGFVVLGSKLDGGVAALSLRVAGIVETGSTDLDRALVRVQLAALQDEFGLGDRAHMIVLRLERFELAEARVPRIDAAIAPLATNAVALSWQQLMPEVSQTIQLKRAGSLVMFGLIALLVTFSIFNSFMMSVFERTREIGMLLAIGMRPGRHRRRVAGRGSLACAVGRGHRRGARRPG